MWCAYVSNALDLCYMSSAVSDVDGDVVRCRWAESAQGECGDVCQAFPAVLDQVGASCVTVKCNTNQLVFLECMQVCISLLECQIM